MRAIIDAHLVVCNTLTIILFIEHRVHSINMMPHLYAPSASDKIRMLMEIEHGKLAKSLLI